MLAVGHSGGGGGIGGDVDASRGFNAAQGANTCIKGGVSLSEGEEAIDTVVVCANEECKFVEKSATTEAGIQYQGTTEFIPSHSPPTLIFAAPSACAYFSLQASVLRDIRILKSPMEAAATT
ncbi:unnamed protein product [Schistocephalus solidus]|uniref:Uncharacterized protein n=1 Tax=Schistocephalus solidus TaxID=70667 RepID=A0A183T5X7_SCHSO|nr:unnamed protein product [Schistocephalus solidus]